MTLKVTIGVQLPLSGVRTVISDCDLTSSSFYYVSVDGIVANVHLTIRVPSFQVFVGVVKYGLWELGPDDIFGLLSPEFFLVFN